MDTDFLIHRWLNRPRTPTSAGFILLPMSFLAGPVQILYQLAWEQAQRQTRPSILERDWLAVWN